MPEKVRIEDIPQQLVEAGEERKELMHIIKNSVEDLMTRIESFEKRVEGVEARVGAIEKGRIVGLERRAEVLEYRLTGLEGKTIKDMKEVKKTFGNIYDAIIDEVEKKLGRGEGVTPVETESYIR